MVKSKLKLISLSAMCLAATVAANEVEKPNILLILADDLGPGMLGFNGQDKVATPALDKLASESMTFNHFYGCTVCAPARSSLLTGLNNTHAPTPNRGGLEIKYATGLIDKDTYEKYTAFDTRHNHDKHFVGEMAQAAGYKTAYFGKLGIGYTDTAADMIRYGFDYHCGLYDSVINWCFYPEYYWINSKKVMLPTNPKFTKSEPTCPLVGEPEMVYTEDIWLEKCLGYIDDNKNADKPFFIIYSTQLPHGPASIAPKDFVYKNTKGWTTEEQVYASMIDKLDKSVDALMKKLEEDGLSDNTVVIFVGDNGHEPDYYSKKAKLSQSGFWDGHQRGEDIFKGTLNQRGTKRLTFEGGLNIPFFARWPKHIKAGDSKEIKLALYDIMPTLADLMGGSINNPINGISFLPTLLDKGSQKQHEYMLWQNTSGATGDAIIAGDWKLIHEINADKSTSNPRKIVHDITLYNLKEDPYEKNNLASKYPKKVASMLELIEEGKKPLK